MTLISSYIGNGLFDSWSKEKESKSEDLTSSQSVTTASNKMNLNQFGNRSSEETSWMSTATRKPFFTSGAMHSHTAKPFRSSNPFDEDTKNPFDEDL